MSNFDVIIIGAGPSGIAAATALSDAGITKIVVFDREAEIGGIPRHTHHRTFGSLVFKRPLKGPEFLCRILSRCPNVRFETSTTTTAIRSGEVDVATPEGLKTHQARHIILATGARETPRHGRLISGLRPQGIMTTGALQQFTYSAKLRPFQNPVIAGTELASFSAIWTLRALGIKPAAMIERRNRITAYRPAMFVARLMGVPIYYNVEITDIGGITQTDHITLQNSRGEQQEIRCDGVIFSGQFIGDNNLAHASHLTLTQTKTPQVDQNWLSSDPTISVIGNAVHPADMGDQCYLEGLEAGRTVADILATPRSAAPIAISHDKCIKMTTPSIARTGETLNISLHVTEKFTGPIVVRQDDNILYKKRHRCLPARRITLKGVNLDTGSNGNIEVTLGHRK